MENFLDPNHPVWCTITGPSECEKSIFLTIFILNINIEIEKKHLLS